VPRENAWEPSVSINTFLIETLSTGTQKLQVEMQSGGAIEIVAERLHIPNISSHTRTPSCRPARTSASYRLPALI